MMKNRDGLLVCSIVMTNPHSKESTFFLIVFTVRLYFWKDYLISKVIYNGKHGVGGLQFLNPLQKGSPLRLQFHFIQTPNLKVHLYHIKDYTNNTPPLDSLSRAKTILCDPIKRALTFRPCRDWRLFRPFFLLHMIDDDVQGIFIL